MKEDSSEILRLLKSAQAGNEPALERLLHAHTARLSRMIELRLDRRIAARVDIADVIQEVHLVAFQHLQDFTEGGEVPFYFWLRTIAINKLLEIHRRHLGTQKRDAHREVSIEQTSFCDASSAVLAAYLADSGTSPSRVVMRSEVKAQLQAVIDRLPESDKEILALRHFEQLSPSESAQVLQINEKAAAMRYVRALKRMRDLLGTEYSDMLSWL